jgi:hypothetical protein
MRLLVREDTIATPPPLCHRHGNFGVAHEGMPPEPETLTTVFLWPFVVPAVSVGRFQRLVRASGVGVSKGLLAQFFVMPFLLFFQAFLFILAPAPVMLPQLLPEAIPGKVVILFGNGATLVPETV